MASWESGMKVDPIALASLGVYSEVYGAGEQANIANLFASIGFLEDAPDYVLPEIVIRGLNRLGIGTATD